jgi:kumamolisin
MKSQFSKHVPLPGSEKSAPKGRKMAKTNKDSLINVAIKLRPKEPLPDLLSQGVNEQFTPLSPEAFSRRYGTSEADMEIVKSFAHNSGLSIVKTEAGKRILELRGTVAQMEKAFRISLTNYKDSSGCIFRGRKGAIKIPEELTGIVEGIFGLDNRKVAAPKFKVHSRKTKKPVKKAALRGYYPPEIAKLYNYPAHVTGKNQCIAIIELGGGFKTRDISAYFKTLKLPVPKVVAMAVGDGHNSPDGVNGADGEVMLDIEVAGGIAPGATIVVYFAENTGKGFLDAINEAIHSTQYKPAVISISWGSAEGNAGGWTASASKAYNEAFQSAATLGITVCAAAGDNGSGDNVKDKKVHVDFPASSPYVLACGGTLLKTDGNKITSEVVWHESDGGATGGGISEVFPMPAYQDGAGVEKSLNTGKPGRGVPDIAGDADPNSGYTIRVDGKTSQIGGTSAVAPMMAGLIALINESLGKQVGFIHPKLYAHTAVCRDITEGDNITTSTKKGYVARKGWDACTGNGVPDGIKLLGILK